MSIVSDRRVQALCASILVVGAFFIGKHFGAQSHIQIEDDCHKVLFLIDKDSDCMRSNQVADTVRSLEQSVVSYVDTKVKAKEISRASVFYRDLESRRWFGVGSDDAYFPASLSKLPLAVTYFKVADLEPQIFDQNLALNPGKNYSNEGQTVSVDGRMETGKTYSIRTMIEDMLIYSDNRPVSVLTQYMRVDVWRKVYTDFGILKQDEKGADAWGVSPRIIANLFRSLYNGSYLNIESSQELLEILTRAKYMKGIVAGVPTGTLIAHKFGEAKMMENDGLVTPTLHDCGIIYKPENPYILCVMTEGKDFAELERTISDISSLVYKAQ